MKRIVLSLSVILLVILSFLWLDNSISQTEKVTLEIIRFEKELFSVSEENVIEKTKLWHEVFGAFPEIFATKIMQRGTINDAQYYNELNNRLQKSFPELISNTEVSVSKPRQSRQAVAPTTGGQVYRGNRVKMTSDQLRMAREFGGSKSEHFIIASQLWL